MKYFVFVVGIHTDLPATGDFAVVSSLANLEGGSGKYAVLPVIAGDDAANDDVILLNANGTLNAIDLNSDGGAKALADFISDDLAVGDTIGFDTGAGTIAKIVLGSNSSVTALDIGTTATTVSNLVVDTGVTVANGKNSGDLALTADGVNVTVNGGEVTIAAAANVEVVNAAKVILTTATGAEITGTITATNGEIEINDDLTCADDMETVASVGFLTLSGTAVLTITNTHTLANAGTTVIGAGCELKTDGVGGTITNTGTLLIEDTGKLTIDTDGTATSSAAEAELIFTESAYAEGVDYTAATSTVTNGTITGSVTVSSGNAGTALLKTLTGSSDSITYLGTAAASQTWPGNNVPGAAQQIIITGDGNDTATRAVYTPPAS